MKVAYAIVDKKGKIVVGDDDILYVFKTKIAAKNGILEVVNEETGEEETTETVQKVSIIAA